MKATSNYSPNVQAVPPPLGKLESHRQDPPVAGGVASAACAYGNTAGMTVACLLQGASARAVMPYKGIREAFASSGWRR